MDRDDSKKAEWIVPNTSEYYYDEKTNSIRRIDLRKTREYYGISLTRRQIGSNRRRAKNLKNRISRKNK